MRIKASKLLAAVLALCLTLGTARRRSAPVGSRQPGHYPIFPVH